LASKVDKEKCTGCAACVLVCPSGAITIKADGKAEVDPEFCISCGNCKQACEHGAITLDSAGGGY
jgi:ferredoxin